MRALANIPQLGAATPLDKWNNAEAEYLVDENGNFLVTETGQRLITGKRTLYLADQHGRRLVTESGDFLVAEDSI